MQQLRAAMIAAVLFVLCGSFGCAHTYIAANPGDECGEFRSTSTVMPEVLTTPAGQYATYRGACAQYATVRAIAAQHAEVVAAAARVSRTMSTRDALAREAITRIIRQRACDNGNDDACECLDGSEAACKRFLNGEGGAE